MKTTLATIRKYARNPGAIDSGFNTDARGNKEPVFYYFSEELPESFCDGVDKSIRHTGWYTNDDGTTYKDGSGKARGIVVNLPASPGFPDGRFLAGYYWGDNDERAVYPDVFSDEKEAARYADSYAEQYAEMAREDNRKFEAARHLENEIETAFTRMRECLALRHRACMSYVRDEIAELCESIRNKRQTLRTEYADYA